MIAVEVDEASPVPPFEQIRSQVAAAITSGALPPGRALPTVRQLAGDLGLAPNTVARAYRELEQHGLVRTAGRRGTTVAEVPPLTAAQRRGLLRAAADRYAAEAARLGASLDDAVAALRAR